MNTTRMGLFGSLMLVALATPACAAEVGNPDPGPEAEASESSGAPADEENVAEAEQAICSPGTASVCYGWDGGGRRCLALCAGYGYWMDTGTAYWGAYNITACDYIDKGQCTAAGNGFCSAIGSYSVGACWGWQN